MSDAVIQVPGNSLEVYGTLSFGGREIASVRELETIISEYPDTLIDFANTMT